MNENTANSGNDFFYDLLDNPAGLSHSNTSNLQLLINKYPQSSLLRSMFAVTRDEQSINSASAYVDPQLLYKIATDVNSLRSVADEQVVFSEQPNATERLRDITSTVTPPQLAIDESNYFHVPIDSELTYFEDEETEEVGDNGLTAKEDQESEIAEQEITQDEVAQDEVIDGEVVEEETAELTEAEPFTETEQNASETAEPEISDESEPISANEFDEYMSRTDDISNSLNDIGEKPVYPHQEIEDDVFEEIVSIEDIGLEQLAIMDKVAEEHEGEEEDEKSEAKHDANIESSYEVFEPVLPQDEEQKAANIAAHPGGRKTGDRMARYNDEKMPYSFMWWLDKTRKEHAAVYQPFVEGQKPVEAAATIQKPQPPADHLQQQYMENILTVTTVVNELSLVPPKVDAPPPADSKVDKIIERFIQEEPQIKHPASAKLNNENKAKKSSEDIDELVTETLAKIYTEQMLYHKAILTYKKLMLKFPEKSLYFAGQIEQLEKKIN
ncbi:hypothetical protein [Mucilaginibacter auburnensis]|uniref:Uncharacterized protein n=1 Tax=Mucilaginibacter auburnensis TaxID=1457233 RepID=A0A2H9VSM6_9SPHI|nr:hypothetical protein [Mucilaginibacter auburnensis]PJJ83826.1 hypothetical protein CLV57_0821 [Mucilaginibacter auburnensis]